MARPSKLTKDLVTTICTRIAEGESIREITADEKMPAMTTIFRWLQEDRAGFREQYEYAKEMQAELYADEIMDIADDGRNDWIEKERPDGSTFIALNSEAIQRSKLRVDARKWVASKLIPKKYGDKVDLTSKGEALSSVTQTADEDRNKYSS